MSNDVQELELSIKDAKKMVDLGNALERLLKNRDFKKVVQEEYLEQEAIRLVHLKGDGNMQSEQAQRAIDRDISAISAFRQFLDMVFAKADHAREAIAECEEALDEIRAEDAE